VVGITLSPEQISQAPPEVRRWLQQQLAEAFGFDGGGPALHTPQRHLVGCTIQDAQALLSAIQGLLPVVSVFFELGREPAAALANGLRALRLDEMTRHARLQSPEQVVACLQAIDEALQSVCGNPEAVLTTLDGTGHCLVAEVTARSILALWQEIVASRQLGQPAVGSPPPRQAMPQGFQPPYAVSTPGFAVPEQASQADGVA
jgi:hypothetical protein